MDPAAAVQDEAGSQAYDYLQSMPAWLVTSTDVVLVMHDERFPVHGLLLAIHSRVLAEVMGCAPAAQHPKEVPLSEDRPERIRWALSYIYRRASAGAKDPVTFSSQDEALGLAHFAHKYDATDLAGEAEAYLMQMIQHCQGKRSAASHTAHRKGSGYNSYGCPDYPDGLPAHTGYKGTPSTPPWELADFDSSSRWNLVDMLAFASQTHLTALAQTCLDQLTETQHGEAELQSDGRLQLLESEQL